MSGDSYKAKVMRHMLQPPHKQDFESVTGGVLTVIGKSDNTIGGLFGTADFLPDESSLVLADSIEFIAAVTSFSNPNFPVGDAWTFTIPPTARTRDVILFVVASTASVSSTCHVLTGGWSTTMLFRGDDQDLVIVAAYQVTGSEPPSSITVTFTDDLNTSEAIPVALVYRGAGLPVVGGASSVLVANLPGETDFVCPDQTPVHVGDRYFGIAHVNANVVGFDSTPDDTRFVDGPFDGSVAVFDIASTSLTRWGAQTCVASVDGQEGSAHSFILPVGLVRSSPDAGTSVIQQVRQALLVSSAGGPQLDAVGNNHGVPRPENTGDDELYRRVIKALAWLPKGIMLSYYALLAAVFGTQEQVRISFGRPWRVYEVKPNELVVELPVALVAGTLESASYLHGATGFARVPSGPSNTFTTDFDLRLSSAVTLVGLAIHVETSPGTWTDYTVASYSFNAGTSTATVQVSASTLPTGGGRFSLEVPGNGVASYRGDYLASNGLVSTYSTAAGPATNTLSVVGDATKDALHGTTVKISISGAFTTRVVNTVSYNSSANVTQVVLTTTDVPGGQAQQAFVVAQEVADTATTPPHDDRVYLTGTGLYQIVQFYLDLLVRAAGIVVRLEII